jgi:hypothetical protein
MQKSFTPEAIKFNDPKIHFFCGIELTELSKTLNLIEIVQANLLCKYKWYIFVTNIGTEFLPRNLCFKD